jgi:8-oxo-dGTP diphosphatase
MPDRVHVVAAALLDGDARVLIQRRPAHAHQGGLWEFPGGKLEPGEGREQGLQREIHEELGIHVREAEPLIAVPHDYGDRRVLLDVWRVRRWEGDIHPREGQPIAWVAAAELGRYRFPAADRPVLRALRLPPTCLVTPAPGPDEQAWLATLGAALDAGVSLVQVRAPGVSARHLHRLATAAVARCKERAPGVRVVVNADPALALACGAAGVHLDARRLWQWRRRPLDADLLVGVSCHDAADLSRAADLDADYALLGPVAATPTHPGAVAMGFETFARLVARARLPVYALGGMRPGDLGRARRCGAQGIAAIRGLWGAQP